MVTDNELILAARQVAARAYSPYSKYCVGAAVLFEDAADALFVGCNVENASYGLTICAERNAICAGISAGFRRIEKIAIALLNDKGAPQPSFMPCGACRQFMAEFSTDKTAVLVDNRGTWLLKELLPHVFEV
jgi:cytidine deaminase